jgi:hypothetical protein
MFKLTSVNVLKKCGLVQLESWGVETTVLGSSYFSSVPPMKHMEHIRSLSCSNLYDAVTFNKLSEQVRIAERPVIGRELVRIFVGSLDRLLLPPLLLPLLLLPPLLLLLLWLFSVSLCESFNRTYKADTVLAVNVAYSEFIMNFPYTTYLSKLSVNPLRVKRNRTVFIYRAINTPHIGYKSQSVTAV